MKSEFLNRLVSISLRTRLFREWQKAHQLGVPSFSERELLTLEVVNDFKNITEKDLSRLFGLSPSSVNDLVSRLVEERLLTKPEGTRGKPLSLTKEGQQQLSKMKQANAKRLEYLFESFGDQDWDTIMPLLEKIGEAAQRHIETAVFRDDSTI